MNRSLSPYLDLVRVACAVLVVLSHLGHGHLVGGALWRFTALGNEAVMAFFVLSGFVIAYVADQRETTLSAYTAARLARLYSVILPAMALTALLDVVGHSINAESYVATHAHAAGSAAMGYGLSLVMLNQSWGLAQHFGSNAAYWSIPYEFWYYAMFGAATYLSGWQRWAAVAGAAALAGPDILVLLPVWLLGVGTYRLLKSGPPPLLRAGAAALGSLLVLCLMLWRDSSSNGQDSFATMVPNSLTWKYLIGLLVALHIYGMATCAQYLQSLLKRIEKPLAPMSGATLALYLFHLPVIGVIHAFAVEYGKSDYTTAALLLLPPAVALTFGRWCELQKTPLRRLLLRQIVIR